MTDQPQVDRDDGADEAGRPWRVLLLRSLDFKWVGLRAMLQGRRGFQVVGDTGDVAAALSLAGTEAPDLMLLGDDLRGFSPVEIAIRLRRQHPQIRLMILCEECAEEILDALLRVPVDGLASWHAMSVARLRCAVDAVLAGFRVADGGLPRFSDSVSATDSPTSTHCSDLERAVLRGLARGMRQREIAAAESASLRTVEDAVRRLKARFHASTPAALVARAMATGIVNGDGEPKGGFADDPPRAG